MPKTLQEAIKITRALRVRYLWIDALCIMQVKEGENEDWHREFPNMGKIFRHSLFTIAASGAESSSVGCFYRREASRWPVQNYFLVDENRPPGPDNPVILEATLPNWNIAVEHSALAKRGWVLQERMLASRTLFWTEDGLFWDCSKLNASEYEAKLLYSNRKFPMLRELVESVKEYKYNSRYEQKVWTNVLEEFSQKALTVVTDKLPAIAGLGSELSRLTGQEFEMGVWKHNLVQELAWVADFSVLGKSVPVDPQAARLPKTPSWSWASTHQKLHFKPGRWNSECEELVTIDLVSVPSVSVNAQQLRVRGRLGELRVRKRRTRIALSYELVYHPTRCTFEPIRAEPDEDSYNKKEVAVLDTLADALPEEGGTIRCLRWMKWKDILRRSSLEEETRYHEVTGAMIVSQVDKKENIYRRIGWVEVVDDDFFNEENETIILV
ncbi:hypothetical protein W97_01625 [Coniosporium apollinis CBS 100218]|uniref:Heterokaryon incompatibility domain-containing protein n=1 Tax=Coniosporium apollinis (strain CBS 100218) TaxID=1168221 RepID=R7YKI5_CONA1|nr:uncharacterized protein W97_01625 [Coniosporium apollinis CBS 100218]EON62403.1 hypothetical protein W97_01625 [Coniosporium apollinis CBS 100218]